MSDTPRHFIQQIIDADIASGKWGVVGDPTVVRTRFPPEPNGFLHIGHTKAICLSYGLAREYDGAFNLRFDDTNPAKEEQVFVDSIKHDLLWLGANWHSAKDGGAHEGGHGGGLYYASDIFDKMYEWALLLVRHGKAYVCELSAAEVSERRGSPSKPATSPWRDRPSEESLRLIEEMRDGQHADGSMTLRARIDLASPNFNLRDPVMYRIVRKAHHNTGDTWCIYPMYDWAHGLEDSVEGITHSLCTLEFEDHRPLYDWYIRAINEALVTEGKPAIHHAQQIEFAKLKPTYVVLSKRNMRAMVEDGVVDGWDDPRFPTIAGIRRRGYTPEAIWAFNTSVGITKFNALHDITLLENALREDLNERAPRRMVVLDPLKVTITNWGEHGDENRLEALEAVNNPEDASAGKRTIRFGKTIYIEREDFMEDAPRKFFRLKPGGEVRLRYAYWITCHEVIKDSDGNIVELKCTYDPQTRGGDSPPPDAEGNVRKVKGTLHWVSADDALDVEVRLFDRLFTVEEPGKASGNFLDDLNEGSLTVLAGCKAESSLHSALVDEPVWGDGIRRYQFERQGYFCVESEGPQLVFNRAVGLKDSWGKASGRG